MRKRNVKKGICLFMLFLMLCSGMTVNAEKDQIKLSNKEYLVSLMEAGTLFMSNERAVSGEVGSKMFLTYTVEEVTQNTSTNNGVIGTKDHTQIYPYTKDGKLNYSKKSQLFEVGYTYVFRFERTASGFTYECAKMKGGEAININFANEAKNGDGEDYNYYGIWIDGDYGTGVSALLNHVRCYDEKGNDLGIHFNLPTGVVQSETNALLDIHLKVNTYYSFSLDEVDTFAISNKYSTKSDVVYMEYEVSDVKDDHTTQQGAIVTRSPKDGYPHTNGKLLYKACAEDEANKPLLRDGGKYFICFQKKDESFEVTVQCTINGETETFTFPWDYGTYQPDAQYFSLWFGDGADHSLSATFNKFKCYDAKGNNLGVQFNRTIDAQISLHGEPEDYTKSEAVYYCQENHGFIVLTDSKKGTRQLGAEKEECSYIILNNDELYLTFTDGKETYEYTAMMLKDADGNKYKRMRNSIVTFVTGETSDKVEAEAANGYRVVQPEEPTQEGNTFLGWYRSDGTAYDFDTVVTKDFTLYAKWKDSQGNEYLAVDALGAKKDVSMIIATVVSATILIGCAVGCILIVRKGKKDGNK